MSRFTASHAGVFPAAPVRPGLLRWLAAARRAYRTRQHLAHLDTDQLRDVGITERAAQTEAKRPVWDVPAHWIE